MNAPELIDTARTLVAGDKGLLAMDESNPTCSKRFARLGIPQTEEAWRAYRELLVTTPGLGECISGMILCDDTIRQPMRLNPLSPARGRPGRGVASSAVAYPPHPALSPQGGRGK
jgi:fructose-bisphosphate aldolase class 1